MTRWLLCLVVLVALTGCPRPREPSPDAVTDPGVKAAAVQNRAPSPVDAGLPAHTAMLGGVSFDVSCEQASDCAFTNYEGDLRCSTRCGEPGLVVHRRELEKLQRAHEALGPQDCPVADCMPPPRCVPVCQSHLCAAKCDDR